MAATCRYAAKQPFFQPQVINLFKSKRKEWGNYAPIQFFTNRTSITQLMGYQTIH
jgi:hypothetical protein